MRVVIILLFIINTLLFSNENILDFYKEKGYEHFEFDCYSDTTKLIEKNNYKPIFRFENTIKNMGTYCNTYWVVEDEKYKKFFIIRNSTNYLKDMKKYNLLNKKYIIFQSTFRDKLKKLSKKSEFYNLKWWIYKKEISEDSFRFIKNELGKIKFQKETLFCKTFTKLTPDKKLFDNYYKDKINNHLNTSFNGRLTFTYPKKMYIDFLLRRRGDFNNAECKSLKKIANFVFKEYETNNKLEKYNKELNKKIVKYIKKGVLFGFKTYSKYRNKNLCEILKLKCDLTTGDK